MHYCDDHKHDPRIPRWIIWGTGYMTPYRLLLVGCAVLVWRTVPACGFICFLEFTQVLEIDVGLDTITIPSVFWGIGEAVKPRRLSGPQCIR